MWNMSKVNHFCIAITTAALTLAATLARAADPYPNAPVKIVVGFAAGGGSDVVARLIAQGLSTRLGQAFTVENKPGAGGSLGTASVTSATPDGYTLLLGSNGTMILNPLLYPHIKYNVERDFVTIAGITSLPFLIAANPKLPVTDIRGLTNLGKTQKLTYASSGNGTTSHLVGVMLESASGTDMIHVPYRGAAPAMNDVVSGQVNFLSGDLSTLMPMVSSGKLRPIAVTGKQRITNLPNVPTVAESGFLGFEASGWFGLFAPRGTPAHVIEKIGAEVALLLKDPRIEQRLRDLGGTVLEANSGQLKDLIQSETRKWRKVIVDNRVTADALM